MLLVGDGSGSKWSRPGGWGCVSVERRNFERKVWYGAANDITVNVTELTAYLFPLLWYSSQPGGIGEFRDVHIITDSTYAKNLGNSTQRPSVNSALWSAFKDFERDGMRLHWHWLERESTQLNSFADILSKESRLLIATDAVKTTAALSLGYTPKDVNT